MFTICHVFDESAGWEQRIAARQLYERLPADRFAQHAVTIDSTAAKKLHAHATPLGPPLRGESSTLLRREAVQAVHRLANLNFLAAPSLRRIVDRKGVDLIHAWGPSAAAAARSACDLPVVVELFDPALAAKSAKVLRTLSQSGRFAVSCSAQWVRRRVIENGLAPEVATVIRPGVDFAALQQAKKSTLRSDLGLTSADFAVLGPEPAGNMRIYRDAFWAVTLLNHLEGRHKFILSGQTPEHMERFERALPTRPTLILPGAVAFESLVAVADALVVPDPGDISTTAVAWAFGAGAPVIAAAGYAVTELVVSKVNGLLYKHVEGKSPAIPLVALLQDRAAQAKVKEAARGQAYEIFSIRRYVEQHMQLYENVIQGADAIRQITDPAQVA